MNIKELTELLIDLFKHKPAESCHSLCHIRRHPYGRTVHAVGNHIMYHSVQADPGGNTKDFPVFLRDIFLLQYASPHCIINIMVNICNLI